MLYKIKFKRILLTNNLTILIFLGFGRSEVDRGSYRGADADKVTEAGPGAVPVGGTW